MKKLLIALLAISTLLATSCKKENEIAPLKANKIVEMIDKTNVGSWD